MRVVGHVHHLPADLLELVRPHLVLEEGGEPPLPRHGGLVRRHRRCVDLGGRGSAGGWLGGRRGCRLGHRLLREG